MKGVLLHGGAGTRLRPLTFTGPKRLIPVANKPVSQYCLEDMIGAGIKEVAIILGETYPEMVEEHYGDGSRFGCKITYIHQGKPLGIAHAVYLAKDFVGDEKFVVYLGDNLIQDGIKEYVKRFDEEDFDAFILLKEVEDPRAFGVAKFEGERLVGLIEKPKEPPSNYAVIGVYMFKPVVFDIIKDLKPSWRGELEITDTLQKMIENGYNVGYAKLKGWWFDTGKAEDILKVNATILDERAKRSVKGEVLASQIEGRVEVGEGAKITNSIVRGPAVIGEDCIIENSFIGPYTSVGERTVIKNSSLEYCIVLSESIIEGVERIEESLIGRKVRIRKSDRKRFLRFTIGDYSEILL